MIDEACQQGLLDRPVMAAVDEKSLVRPDDDGCGQDLWNRLDLQMCRIRLPDMMVLVAGDWNIRDNARGVAYI